ncbi:MAG: protein-export chaperone SecB [Pseudomonadota bacterium]
MSDAPTTDAQQQQQPPRLQVQNQYIRDLSFENLAVQKGAPTEGKPEVAVQVALDANKKGDNLYEVVVKTKIDSKVGEAQLFILELEYAGQFRIENVPDGQMHPFLLIECPRMLFPFIRRIVSDVSRDGGFPPLNLENIDFLQLYRQEIQRRQAAQETASA